MWFIIKYCNIIFIFAVLERRLIHFNETECMVDYVSKTRSRPSYASALDWDILSKSGTETDFRLLRQVSLIEIAQNVVEKLQI